MLTRLATGAITRYNWVAPLEAKTEEAWLAYNAPYLNKWAGLKRMAYEKYIEALEEEEDAYDPIYQVYKFTKKQIPKFKKLIITRNNQQVIIFKKIRRA